MSRRISQLKLRMINKPSAVNPCPLSPPHFPALLEVTRTNQVYWSAAGAGGSGGGAGTAEDVSREASENFLEAGGAGGADAAADSYLGSLLEERASDELDSSVLREERRLLEDDCLGAELLDSVELESELLDSELLELERLELERLEPV